MHPFVERSRRWLAYRRRQVVSSWYYSNRHFYQRAIRQRRWRYAMQQLQGREPELFESARTLVQSLKFDAEVPHPRYADMLFLLEKTLRLKPQAILECGAGASTLAFAHALHRLEQETGVAGQLVSMDESAAYLNQMVLPAFPERLRKYVEFVASPVVFRRYTDAARDIAIDGICYRDVPARRFDMIYVDGPETRRNAYSDLTPISGIAPLPPGLSEKPFDSDCFEYVMNADQPTQIVIDQRIDTRWKILRLMAGRVTARYHYAAQKTVINLRPEQLSHLHSEVLGEEDNAP